MGHSPFQIPDAFRSSTGSWSPGADDNVFDDCVTSRDTITTLENGWARWARQFAVESDAGGDVKGGSTAGETDEFSQRAADEPIPIRDVHGTILDLMGLDDERLRYLS